MVDATAFMLPLKRSFARSDTPKKIHKIAAVGRKIQVKNAIVSAIVKLPCRVEILLSLALDPDFGADSNSVFERENGQ